jgi:hypothetical protein
MGGAGMSATDTRIADVEQARTAALAEHYLRVAGEPFVSAEGPRPGYVVGRCGHAVAASEWRAGFRVCERCPDIHPDPDDGPGRDQHGRHDAPTLAQRMAETPVGPRGAEHILDDGMVGPAYRVEHERVPFDEVLLRAAEERHTLDPDAQDYHRRQALNSIRYCGQAGLAEIVTAVRELQDADALASEYEPAPMLRSELVGKLNHRRDVFVYVYVPVDGRGPARLGVTRVHYLSDRDHIALYTAPWFLGVEPDPSVSAEGVTVSELTAERFGTRDGAQA